MKAPLVTRARCGACRRPVELHQLGQVLTLIERDAAGVPSVHACPEEARSRWRAAWHLARLERLARGRERRLIPAPESDS